MMQRVFKTRQKVINSMGSDRYLLKLFDLLGLLVGGRGAKADSRWRQFFILPPTLRLKVWIGWSE
jgi:hypothetical protein